jgi:tartrate dehydratase alpha subunit/fumarate hydratase class I-like protein
VVNVTINATGGGSKEIAAAVSSPSTLEQVTKAIVDALQSAGVPVPS